MSNSDTTNGQVGQKVSECSTTSNQNHYSAAIITPCAHAGYVIGRGIHTEGKVAQ